MSAVNFPKGVLEARTILPDHKERNVVAALAQEAFAAEFVGESDLAGSDRVFSLQPVHPISGGSESAAPDSSPLLQKFIDEGILTPDQPLDLAPKEERALRDMFSQYHLQNRLCAVDLILFDFYKSLYRLPKTSPAIELLIERFFSDYFSGYLGIHYEYNRRSGNVTQSEFFTKYFHSQEKFAQLIEQFNSDLSHYLSLWKDQQMGALKSQYSGGILDKKIEGFKKSYSGVVKELLALAPKFSLLAKMLRHPGCCELLVQKNLLYYSGSEHLNAVHLGEGLDDCLELTKCFSHVLICAHKFKRSALYTHLETPQKLLQSLRHREIAEAHVFKWQNFFQQFAKETGPSWEDHHRCLVLAMNGELTYDEYAVSKAVPKDKRMPQAEFVEYLLGLDFQYFIVDGWITDLNRCTSHQIFQPRFPHLCYEPQSYTYRLASNLNAMSDIDQSLKAQAGTYLGSPFQLGDAPGLLQKCRKLVISKTWNQSSKLCDLLVRNKRFEFDELMLELQELMGKTFSYSRWLETLRVFEAFLPDLKKTLVEIARNRREMLAEIEVMVNKVAPTLSKEERERLKYEIRETVKMQSLDLCRLIMIFADVEALLQRRELDEETHLLPPDLVDFMTVEGLDEIFEKVEASLLPKEPEAVVVIPIPQPAVPKVRKAAARVIPAAEAEPLPSMRDLQLAKRRRDLMDFVHKLGWWTDRIRGDHEIVTNGTRTVSIPGAGKGSQRLARGTQHAIARALTEDDQKGIAQNS